MSERLDIIVGGPCLRFTAPATGHIRLRLTSDPAKRRRFEIRIVTSGGVLRYRQGAADVVASRDTTETDGTLGRLIPDTQRWPIDLVGEATQFLSIVEGNGTNVAVIFEISQTDGTGTSDLVTDVT